MKHVNGKLLDFNLLNKQEFLPSILCKYNELTRGNRNFTG
jgi:hypothetical protein